MMPVREMFLVGVHVEQDADVPVLLLRESDGDRVLPLAIGAAEANAIILEQQGLRPARPLTHDLLGEVIEAFGRRLDRVLITDLRDGTFYAELVFDDDVRVSARPSDSVALALRVGAGIHADEQVLDEAGQVVTTEQDEVAKFREFLDSASPEDFHGEDT